MTLTNIIGVRDDIIFFNVSIVCQSAVLRKRKTAGESDFSVVQTVIAFRLLPTRSINLARRGSFDNPK